MSKPKANGRPSTVRDLVRTHFLDLMPEDLKSLRDVAVSDLYSGPFQPDDVEEQLGVSGYTYQTALKKLNDWWDDNGETVYIDTEAGLVSTGKPEEGYEDDDGQWVENDLSGYHEIDASEAKRIVFGSLVTDGGM